MQELGFLEPGLIEPQRLTPLCSMPSTLCIAYDKANDPLSIKRQVVVNAPHPNLCGLSQLRDSHVTATRRQDYRLAGRVSPLACSELSLDPPLTYLADGSNELIRGDTSGHGWSESSNSQE
jgi:hypothetical protein